MQHRWRSHIVCAKHNTVCRRQPRFVSAKAERCFRSAKNDVASKLANDVVSLRTQTQKERHDFHRVFLFLAPPVGLEPTTLRLTAACSTD